MRILIADADIKRTLSIEKAFSSMGSFNILTLSNYRDLRTLTYYCPQRFGMVVVNAELLDEMAIEPSIFFEENPCIRHLLIYDHREDHQWSKTFFKPHPSRWMRLISAFDHLQLADFLMLVDPEFEALAETMSGAPATHLRERR